MLLNLCCCKFQDKQHQILTDNEWSDITGVTLGFAKGDVPYVLKEYGNIELRGITLSVYVNCSDIGYAINDSILNNIKNRKNKLITNRLDTINNIRFVSDTKGFNHNFVTYSEPFYVNNEILCLSMSNRIVSENKTLEWVFFLKKKNGKFRVLTFYDVQKDVFYDPVSF